MRTPDRTFILALTMLMALTILSVNAQVPFPKAGNGLSGSAGDSGEVRSAIMNANNVTFILYNDGQVCRPNMLNNIADLVWHRLGHMFEFGPIFAAEVMDADGDTVHILDDGFSSFSSGDYSPDLSIKWGWLPRAGFARADRPDVATSGNPDSWPSSWSAWPGEQGSGVVFSLDEAYYVVDDFTNAEFLYFPFPEDSSRRGLGVSAEVRIYQFGDELSDAVLISYKLKNESTKSLPKCYFGFYADPHIGGGWDYGDDLVSYVGPEGPIGDTAHYWSRNTIYNWDADGMGEAGLPTGYLGFKFLQTPGNKDLTAFSALLWTGSPPNVPKNDELFWQILSADSIDRHQSLFTNPNDNVNVFGTGPFSLSPGESTYVSLAIFFSESFDDILSDASLIHLLKGTTTDISYDFHPIEYLLSQNYPNPFNPSTTIRYGLPQRSHVTLTVFNTLGQQVATLVHGEQDAGHHEVQFDASGLASGVYLYRLQAGEFVQTRKLVFVR